MTDALLACAVEFRESVARAGFGVKEALNAPCQLFDALTFADLARNFGQQFFGVPAVLGVEAEVAALVLQNDQGVSVVECAVEGFLLFPLQPGFVKE